VLGLDDRVDHEIGRKAEQVDIGSLLGPTGGDEGGPLVGIDDRLDPVVEDGVDRQAPGPSPRSGRSEGPGSPRARSRPHIA